MKKKKPKKRKRRISVVVIVAIFSLLIALIPTRIQIPIFSSLFSSHQYPASPEDLPHISLAPLAALGVLLLLVDAFYYMLAYRWKLKTFRDSLSYTLFPPAVDGWQVAPRYFRNPWKVKALVIEPNVILGDRKTIGRIRVPFAEIPAQALRSQISCMLFAAAVSTLYDQGRRSLKLPEVLADMNLNTAQFRRQFPVLGEITVRGCRGKVVQDGKGQRAFFMQHREDYQERMHFLEACTLVMEGTRVRSMTDTERSHLMSLPSGALLFATTTVHAGAPYPGGLTYLGSLVTVQTDTVNEAVMQDLDSLLSDGYQVEYMQPGSPSQYDPIVELGVPIPACRTSEGRLRLNWDGSEDNFAATAFRRILSGMRERTLAIRVFLALPCMILLNHMLLGQRGFFLLLAMTACLFSFFSTTSPDEVTLSGRHRPWHMHAALVIGLLGPFVSAFLLAYLARLPWRIATEGLFYGFCLALAHWQIMHVRLFSYHTIIFPVMDALMLLLGAILLAVESALAMPLAFSMLCGIVLGALVLLLLPWPDGSILHIQK